MNKRLAIVAGCICFYSLGWGIDIDSLKHQLSISTTDTKKISILNHIGKVYYESENDSAVLFLNQAHQLAEKVGSKKYQAITLQNFGCFFVGKSSLDTAVSLHQKALESFIHLADTFNMAEQYAHLANVFQGTGQFEKALPFTMKAGELYDILGKTAKAVTVRSNLSEIYMRLNDPDKALEAQYAVLNHQPVEEIQQFIPSVYVNIGYIYFQLGRIEEALEQFQLSLHAAQQIQSRLEEGIAYGYSGKALIHLKRYDEAIPSILRAKAIFEDLEDHFYLAKTSANLSEIYNDLGRYKKARPYAEKAIKLAQELNILWIENLAQHELAVAQKALGNANAAYDAMVAHKVVNNQIWQEAKTKEIANIQFKYEVEQKEKENALLKKDIEMQHKVRNFLIAFSIFGIVLLLLLLNRFLIKRKAHKELIEKNQLIEIQRKELEEAYEKLKETNEEVRTQAEILEEANATKDKFFSIIAHDLKNPFNSILGLSELLLKNLEQMTKKKIRSYVDTIFSASNITYNLLTNLLVWARSQSNHIQINKEELNLAELITSSITPYMENAEAKKLSVINEITNGQCLTGDRYTLTTVFGNLFSNAIKFTQKGGSITLSVDKEAEHLAVHVKDTGVGMTDEEVNKLFKITESYSKSGTEEEQGTGLGLILCKEFVEKNQGEIQVASTQGEGTTFTVLMPLN